MSGTGSGKYHVHVLFDGYSKTTEEGISANCTCTLITGPQNIIVDTMTAWDGPKLRAALEDYKLTPNDINWVICTHGHSDHIGCNYLFQQAKHIVGFCYSYKDIYYECSFASGQEMQIDEGLKIVPTPGHTLQDVSVLVEKSNKEVIAITGDLFEREEDLNDDSIWKAAGSDSEVLQEENRRKILELARWIVPGHGPMFEVLKKC